MSIQDFEFIWTKIDPLTLAAIWFIVWYQIKPIKLDISTIKGDISSLKADVQDLDRRLCRMEGAMTSKECCMLKDDRQLKKAE